MGLFQQALEISKGQAGVYLPVAGRPLIGLGSIALERYDIELALQSLLDGIQHHSHRAPSQGEAPCWAHSFLWHRPEHYLTSTQVS
jgi:hypothetical protein